MPRTLPAFFLKCLAFSICLAAFAGCASVPIASGTRAVIAVPKAAFYKYGPAQTFGPDFLLNEGVIVTVLQRDFGFTRVMTDDGTAGYVSSDELKSAPPAPAPASTASAGGNRASSSSSKPKRSNIQPTPGSPLFEAGDLAPLPENSDPSKPAPNFRF